jgi:tetratricopeptide (TPR) repeat protein
MNEKPRARLIIRIAALFAAIALGGAVAAWFYQYLSAGSAQVPGNSQAIVEALQKKGRGADAESVKASCASKAGSVCHCAEFAAPIALNQDLGNQSLELLETAIRTCGNTPLLRGLRSEALARMTRIDESLAEAAAVLGQSAQNPYASYAMAQSHFAKGDLLQARSEAAQAVQNGRGAPAYLLLGLIAYRNNNFPEALADFEKILETDASNVPANFNRAFVLHRMNRYHDAREAYLKVTQLEPTNLDARFNLGLLAHSIGADDEARHHLEKLRALAPGDERVTKLSGVLAATGAGNAATASPQGSAGK